MGDLTFQRWTCSPVDNIQMNKVRQISPQCLHFTLHVTTLFCWQHENAKTLKLHLHSQVIIKLWVHKTWQVHWLPAPQVFFKLPRLNLWEGKSVFIVFFTFLGVILSRSLFVTMLHDTVFDGYKCLLVAIVTSHCLLLPNIYACRKKKINKGSSFLRPMWSVFFPTS